MLAKGLSTLARLPPLMGFFLWGFSFGNPIFLKFLKCVNPTVERLMCNRGGPEERVWALAFWDLSESAWATILVSIFGRFWWRFLMIFGRLCSFL